MPLNPQTPIFSYSNAHLEAFFKLTGTTPLGVVSAPQPSAFSQECFVSTALYEPFTLPYLLINPPPFDLRTNISLLTPLSNAPHLLVVRAAIELLDELPDSIHRLTLA
jgi:hypothetical protein